MTFKAFTARARGNLAPSRNAPFALLALLVSLGLVLGCQPSRVAGPPAPTMAPPLDATSGPTVSIDVASSDSTAVVESGSSSETVSASVPIAQAAPLPPAPAASAAPVEPATFSAARAYADLEHLAIDIGSRPGGSPAQDQAAEYLEREFRKAGLVVEQQQFTFSNYVDRGAQVDLLRPESASLQARGLMYSPSADLEGAVVDVSLARPGDFETAAVQGKIAVAERGEITFREKVANLAAAGAKAVIIANNASGVFSGNLGQRSDIPALAVSQADGDRLQTLAQQGSATVRIKLDAEVTDQVGRNVIATLAGGPRVVVVGAHFDSVSAGPGANDNASGTATILEMARIAATRQYPFTIKFIAFGVEELGLIGSRHYVSQLDQEAREAMVAMINLDMVGVGDRLSFGGDGALVEAAIRQAADMGLSAGQLRDRAGTGSDHAAFQAVGVPVLFVYRGEDPRYHTAEDKAEFVMPSNLAIAGQIGLELLDELAARSP